MLGTVSSKYKLLHATQDESFLGGSGGEHFVEGTLGPQWVE